MLVVIARLTVDPDHIDEFEALARQLRDATLRTEPGCRRYEYARLPDRGAYVSTMTFDDHDAFLTHQASSHHTEIATVAMRRLIRSIELDFAASLDGAFGPIDGAADHPLHVDEELRAHYAQRYPPLDLGAWGS